MSNLQEDVLFAEDSAEHQLLPRFMFSINTSKASRSGAENVMRGLDWLQT
jgi:hypothetical protein